MDRTNDSAPDVSSDQIPNLIKIGAIPSEYGQTLSTDIIDPVTFNQNRMRFTMSRVSGFLHSKSKITLAVTPLTNSSAYYPVNIGVSQLIQSAELRVGNKTICQVDDYATFHAYQSLFITNENNKEREQYLSQRLMSHKPLYDNNRQADDTKNAAAKVTLDTGLNPVVNTANDAATFKLLPFQLHDATSADTVSEAPVYSVYLSDLFPFLRTNQLPAFMINEEIHVDITFQDGVSSLSGGVQSRRLCCAEGETETVDYQINQDECKLIYDSISYDGEVMRKYAEQNKRLVFQYVDYRLAKRTGPQGDFTNLTFQLGGNGRLVSKVMFALQKNGNYVAESLMNGDGVAKAVPTADELAVNLRYNDRFEYSVDRKNKALLFTTTQQSEGQVPMVTRDEYQNNGVSALTTNTLEGHDQSGADDGLGGNFNWTAIRLNKGERVNNKGLELTYKAPNLGADTYTLRCYLELLKVATIEDGVMNCYFA
jgi:hypothetical protein